MHVFQVFVFAAGLAIVLADNPFGILPVIGSFGIIVLARAMSLQAFGSVILPLMIILTGLTLGMLNASMHLPTFDWLSWGALFGVPLCYLIGFRLGRWRRMPHTAGHE
jgi:hypothetical protein